MKKNIDNKFYVYRFRLYPNVEQIAYLDEQMSYNRFVYNFFLERAMHLYKTHNIKFNYYEFKKILPLLKKGFSFLKEANSQSLQVSLKALDTAFQKFFKKQAGYPNFKKKGIYSSIVIPQNFEIKDGFINIPKLKSAIKVKFHRKVYEAVKSISISKTTSGKYYVNILVEKFDYSPYIHKKAVCVSTGIDLGLKDFAIITTGTDFDNKENFKIPNNKYLLRSQKLLVKLSRQLGKKVHKRSKQDKTVVSKNYIKFKKRLSLLHERISNQREDFLHKLSLSTVNDSQVIVLEDLNINGMVKNRHLSKAISDASWSMFAKMLKYKSELYGRQVFKVNRFYPSSKTCSTPDCGYVYKDLKLSERSWTCPECGTIHDRDINASINLFIEGLKVVGQGLPQLTPEEYAPAGYQNIGIMCHTVRQEAYQFIDR